MADDLGEPGHLREAGRLQANVLTHLLGQDDEKLAEKIRLYRDAFAASAGGAAQGHVTLMLHTYLGGEVDEIREVVRGLFSTYIRSALDLELAASRASGDLARRHPSEEDLEYLVRQAFDRYLETSGLFGTSASCRSRVERLESIGVDEIACLIDFGIDEDAVLASLEHVIALSDDVNDRGARATVAVGAPESRAG